MLAPTKLWPEVNEGYIGAGAYEVYAVQKWHGNRQLRISMPKQRFIAMPYAARHSWLAEARRRVELGRV